MSIDIFVSVGRTFTIEQERFVLEVETYLREQGFTPRTVGRNSFSSIQPLKFIKKTIKECAGTVIIAFERVYIEQGYDKRKSNEERLLTNISMPTVWNHIEATMAYVLDLPLLVIVQKGLKEEGLLEAGYDWYIQKVDLIPENVHTREFITVFDDWKSRVLEKSQG